MELESVGGSDGEGDRYSSIDEDSNTMSEGDEAILEDLYGTTRYIRHLFLFRNTYSLCTAKRCCVVHVIEQVFGTNTQGRP